MKFSVSTVIISYTFAQVCEKLNLLQVLVLLMVQAVQIPMKNGHSITNNNCLRARFLQKIDKKYPLKAVTESTPDKLIQFPIFNNIAGSQLVIHEMI
jgi:hypothetical protein